MDDSVVWIDPLDGTLSFLRNELDCVTTLIGNLEGIIGKMHIMFLL